MIEAPCGCDEIDAAQMEMDPAAKKARIKRGERLAAAWACPNKGHPEPGEDDELLPLPPGTSAAVDRQQAIDAVGQVKHVSGERCATCPHWYTQHPLVHAASEVYGWRKDGTVAPFEEDLSPALVTAIGLIDIGIKRGLAFVRKRAEKPK